MFYNFTSEIEFYVELSIVLSLSSISFQLELSSTIPEALPMRPAHAVFPVPWGSRKPWTPPNSWPTASHTNGSAKWRVTWTQRLSAAGGFKLHRNMSGCWWCWLIWWPPPGPSFEIEMKLGRKLGDLSDKGVLTSNWHVQGWQNHLVYLGISLYYIIKIIGDAFEMINLHSHCFPTKKRIKSLFREYLNIFDMCFHYGRGCSTARIFHSWMDETVSTDEMGMHQCQNQPLTRSEINGSIGLNMIIKYIRHNIIYIYIY